MLEPREEDAHTHIIVTSLPNDRRIARGVADAGVMNPFLEVSRSLILKNNDRIDNVGFPREITRERTIGSVIHFIFHRIHASRWEPVDFETWMKT